MSTALKKGILDSAKVSLVVGTLLCLINQWDEIVRMEIDFELSLKLALNYIIPFSVAGYSKIQMRRRIQKSKSDSNPQ